MDVWDVHSTRVASHQTNQRQTNHLYTMYNVMDGRILLLQHNFDTNILYTFILLIE